MPARDPLGGPSYPPARGGGGKKAGPPHSRSGRGSSGHGGHPTANKPRPTDGGRREVEESTHRARRRVANAYLASASRWHAKLRQDLSEVVRKYSKHASEGRRVASHCGIAQYAQNRCGFTGNTTSPYSGGKQPSKGDIAFALGGLILGAFVAAEVVVVLTAASAATAASEASTFDHGLAEGSAKVPNEWGPGKANSKGTGTRWQDPSYKGNGVRIDKGIPESNWASQRVDHVVVRSGGKQLGPDGKPLQGSLQDFPEGHIPLSDWLGWSEWNQP